MSLLFQGDPGEVIYTDRFGAKGAVGLPGLQGLPVSFLGNFNIRFVFCCFVFVYLRKKKKSYILKVHN